MCQENVTCIEIDEHFGALYLSQMYENVSNLKSVVLYSWLHRFKVWSLCDTILFGQDCFGQF